MNTIQAMTMMAGAGMFLAGPSFGAIVGIDIDRGTPVMIDGEAYFSYALYAVSDEPDQDVVTCVSGLGDQIGVNAAYWSNDVNTPLDGAGSGFWNATGFGSRSVLFQPQGAPAEWAWDTMLTIGQDNLSTADEPEAQLSPGTSADLSGPGPTIMSPPSGLGAICVTPDNAVGVPDADGRVLIGRFTVRCGEHVSFGANIDWADSSGRGTGSGYFVAGPLTPAPPADLTGDHVVDVYDLLELLSAWGTFDHGAQIADPCDTVDVNDLLGMLAAWGPVN